MLCHLFPYGCLIQCGLAGATTTVKHIMQMPKARRFQEVGSFYQEMVSSPEYGDGEYSFNRARWEYDLLTE